MFLKCFDIYKIRQNNDFEVRDKVQHAQASR